MKNIYFLFFPTHEEKKTSTLIDLMNYELFQKREKKQKPKILGKKYNQFFKKKLPNLNGWRMNFSWD